MSNPIVSIEPGSLTADQATKTVSARVRADQNTPGTVAFTVGSKKYPDRPVNLTTTYQTVLQGHSSSGLVLVVATAKAYPDAIDSQSDLLKV
jgi:hypothetical protein